MGVHVNQFVNKIYENMILMLYCFVTGLNHPSFSPLDTEVTG